MISEDFQRAWRFTGLALDRIGFAVEDRNRQAGIYYVTYNDPAASSSATGFLDSLKFWSDEEQSNKYEIHVKTEDAVSSVSVHDDKGVVLNTDTAKRMLNLLQQQLR
jgi:outer membrane protein assembly factor BamC